MLQVLVEKDSKKLFQHQTELNENFLTISHEILEKIS